MTTATATRTATITGSAGHLADQIGWVAAHLPTRPAVPVLVGVRLSATPDGAVTARGTDYEVWACADLDVDTDGLVDVVLPGRLLSALLSSLPRHLMVTLAVDHDQVRVTCGPTRASLRTLPLEEYPDFPAWPEPLGTVDAHDLAQAVSRIVAAASTDVELVALTGIHLAFGPQGMQAEATDRYRFALATAPWTPTLDGDDTTHTALVPALTLHQTTKALAKSETVNIGRDGDTVSLTGDGRRLMTRLLDGEFPTWERMHTLAQGQDIEVDVAITALRDTIKRVSLFAERTTPLRISITGEGLVVRSGSEDLGAVAEDVDAHVETDRDLVVHVQPHFLTEALAAIPGETVRLSFGHPEKPFLARPGDEEQSGLMWLVMPVRQPTGGTR
ncbi:MULTISPECIES: DNA polymerase III subunit beta [Nocardiopsis]|uniref:DNA polymerase III subunit beta n=1 Tax=Nocardiopsis changdeensis TaxID=2831969 RepID=A0ABX8BZT5_9ACTN|nr:MULTISPECIES: DNA polymerase III subunit beta [Nocardiopsis]QUX26346.1 DNA polymerase III subunit beta [Nocardiopsis changdeensis]QYX40834.1 DNA polymerase III subunit beta [Nocardiopsis sp. MT53]